MFLHIAAAAGPSNVLACVGGAGWRGHRRWDDFRPLIACAAACYQDPGTPYRHALSAPSVFRLGPGLSLLYGPSLGLPVMAVYSVALPLVTLCATQECVWVCAPASMGRALPCAVRETLPPQLGLSAESLHYIRRRDTIRMVSMIWSPGSLWVPTTAEGAGGPSLGGPASMGWGFHGPGRFSRQSLQRKELL